MPLYVWLEFLCSLIWTVMNKKAMMASHHPLFVWYFHFFTSHSNCIEQQPSLTLVSVDDYMTSSLSINFVRDLIFIMPLYPVSFLRVFVGIYVKASPNTAILVKGRRAFRQPPLAAQNAVVLGPCVGGPKRQPPLPFSSADFKSCQHGGKKKATTYITVITVGVVATCIIVLIISILLWRGHLKVRKRNRKDLEGLKLQKGSFTLKQIKAATNNFDSANKIGEGGFGPVYKGLLSDGTEIAVKQLSSKSRQGNREFFNEIGMISCLQHPNLVKLHGCCIEGDQLLLVYEYMENNSLARALFNDSQLILDWPTRFNICIGIARGLAFLHEESRFKIIHRDIKATNVLLDENLNPKISDFGLARLNEDEKTHISTRIAGTIGYMAPEYALWGYLTHKADVYSFGIVALEIVSGKNNNNYMPSTNFVCLLDWACYLQKDGNLEDLLDPRLGSEVNMKQLEKVAKVAMLCTNGSPSLRPTMSEVVSMLEGQTSIPDIVPDPSSYTEDLRFKAMRDFHREKKQSYSPSSSQTARTPNSITIETEIGTSSTSIDNLYKVNMDSMSY